MDNEINPAHVDFWSACPQCGGHDGRLNVDEAHWFVCYLHRTRWCVGHDLFADWRNEIEAVWERNSQILREYEVVEPLKFQQPARDVVKFLLREVELMTT